VNHLWSAGTTYQRAQRVRTVPRHAPGAVDRSQVRTASGPSIMASLRNLAITILRLAGAMSIAAALRYHARRPSRPLHTILKC
jgi:hypothetical protein